MVIFKEKNFGIFANTLKGAAVGASVGGSLTKFALGNKKKTTVEVPLRSKPVTIDTKIGTIGGAIIGATLGLVASAIKTTANYINRRNTVNKRILPKAIDMLTKMGHREGMSFTLDPRKADMLRTKVSLVVYKYSDELRLIVNTQDDQKLNQVTSMVADKIANATDTAYREEASGRFKDLKITSIKGSSVDEAKFIADVASTYITNGYPVYLVEVG